MDNPRFDFAAPLVDVFSWFKGLLPSSLRPGRPHFNFITVHYVYLISLTIIGSILLYPAGLLKYIDAIFFAAGAATQSGLNTIDVNTMHIYQQVVLMLIACVANPVFINTAVVFIRLHWFEKRFETVVKDAQRVRRTRTMSRSRSQAREDQNLDVEVGVRGRPIEVLQDTTKPNGMSIPPSDVAEKDKASDSNGQGTDSSSDATAAAPVVNSGDSNQPDHDVPPSPTFKRDITFADEIRRESRSPDPDNTDRIPEVRSADHHIAFLERQRKQDQGTLRIPGPRDFERGDVPHQIDSDEEDDQRIRGLSRVDTRASQASNNEKVDGDDNPAKRGIAFDVPDKPGKSTNGPRTPLTPSPRFNPLRPFSALKRTRTSASWSRSVQKFRDRTPTLSFSKSQDRDMGDLMPYLSWQPTIGRNSAFIDLSEEQREELGGIEYRSLKTLAIILVSYFVGWHLLGAIVLVPWIRLSKTYGSVVDNYSQNRVWWGIFTPASMFNDLGFTLTPTSMVEFQSAVVPMLFGSFLIVIGNTGFPCFLRFTIWILNLVVPRGSALWEELRFLLDHPRRCFTLLFPSKATWWLFWLLVLLNGLDLIFFIILDLDDPTVTSLAPGTRVMAGWFQAVSTRTAGFACVNLADLHPAIQVSYLVMMYISVFPIAISVRRTNVYEEKSLGIWAGDEEEDEEGNKSYVGMHLRRQLSFDLWYIFMGLFIVAIAEGGRLQNTNEYAFTLFSVLFEIVSAYGTVGLSLGYPNINASFSAEFTVISKLVIVAMMIRGRHRGLPYALDRAILLPSENLHRKETEDATLRAGRRGSMAFSKAPTEERTRPSTDGTQGVAPTTLPSPGPFLPAVTSTSTGSPSQFRRGHSRRMSELSVASGRTNLTTTAKHKKRGLAGLLTAGLGAGPAHSRSFKDE
ncbi:potassium transport protein TRK1/TRK2 [Myriangium duriaei CBS 260.36]|uniref:Potassium transport protein n=1 Tax=Myriangium duriaei CBS 260.36 TaxID=1168546 RepID=A0A9P4J2J3_9PEZI|nr:potassium transport protein TRK1/TRK2 [Myriangium duriaei CBS 260.36]